MLALILMVNLMDDNNYLEHHGILGQRWGVRRYQNYDGSLKVAGKLRRSMNYKEKASEAKKAAKDATNDEDRTNFKKKSERYEARAEKLRDQYEKKYAKAYAKELNDAKKTYDSSFNYSARNIFKNVSSDNVFGASNLVSAGTIALSRFNYNNLKKEALSNIPSNTNYTLKMIRGKYRAVREGTPVAQLGVGKFKPVDDVKISSLKTPIGKAVFGTNVLKMGLDTVDAVNVNMPGRIKVTSKNVAKKLNDIQDVTRPLAGIAQNVNTTVTAVNNAGKIVSGKQSINASISKTTSKQKVSSPVMNTKVSSIPESQIQSGKSTLDKVLEVSNKVLSVAVPTVTLAATIKTLRKD